MGDFGLPHAWHGLELEEHPIDSPKSLKAIVVGAGISGINAAILLPVKVPGLELLILERDSDVGGIWNQCIYPGVRCDVPSHVYQSTFAPSQDWSEYYAQGAEIKAYWAKVARDRDAYRYIRFNHEAISATWNADKAKWLVEVRHSGEAWTEEADFLIVATGVFSHPQMPQYPGMAEYDGHLCHSSRWDPKFDPAGKSIAIIGNGSSGMQILPQLQQVASKIYHYARSPAWIAGNFGGIEGQPGERIPTELRSKLEDPEVYLKYRKEIENRSFKGFGSVVKDGAQSRQSREKFTELMKSSLVSRPDLFEAILPSFSPSCRRLTPGPGYLEALVQPNVNYITTPIQSFTKAGLRTVDGKDYQIDAIICCTGSEKSFAPPFPIVSGSIDLSSAWKPGGSIGFPDTYMGIATPGFPNLLFVNGPQCASATGTLPFATENQITLVARILRKVMSQGISTMTPTRQATDDFRAYCEAYFPRTVQSENCSSWFNGGIKGGRVIGNWPGSGLHANAVRRDPRWEDWEYTYKSSSGNRFAYFGNGWTQKDVQVNREPPEEVDLTPYLQLASVTGQVDLRTYHENWCD